MGSDIVHGRGCNQHQHQLVVVLLSKGHNNLNLEIQARHRDSWKQLQACSFLLSSRLPVACYHSCIMLSHNKTDNSFDVLQAVLERLLQQLVAVSQRGSGGQWRSGRAFPAT